MQAVTPPCPKEQAEKLQVLCCLWSEHQHHIPGCELYSSVTQAKKSSKLYQKASVNSICAPGNPGLKISVLLLYTLLHGVLKAITMNPLSLLPVYHSNFGAQTVCFGFGDQLLKHMKGLSIEGGGGKDLKTSLLTICVWITASYMGPNIQYYSETSKRLNCQQEMS